MKMKNIFPIISLLLLAGALSLQAASGNWTGLTDATWAGANWSAATPGTGDTATFNGAGNANVVINLGGGVTINTVLFNTASAAAYTIGTSPAGGQTLSLNNTGGITMNSTVANNELFNAAIVLGTDATAKTNTIVNNHHPIQVIWNFVNCELYQRDIGARRRRREFAGDDERVLVHLSNFRPVKRLTDVVEIFDRVRKKVPAKMLLIGDGPDRSQAEWLAVKKGIHKHVIFMGKQAPGARKAGHGRRDVATQ